MKALSRSAWIAIAAVMAVPASYAIAKTYERGGWNRMSPETRQRLDEGRVAMAKAALKLTPDQEKLFAPVEEQVRAAFKDRADKRAEWAKKRDERRAQREARKDDGADRKSGDGPRGDRKRADLAERFETMSVDLTKKAERMKAFSGAFKPFYASLTDEQKDVLRPLVRDLAPGFGGRGGRGGQRWAHGGGWGGHEGRGHHGWGGGDRRGDRGGPVIEDKAEAGPDAGDAPDAQDKAE
ncbi:MAG: Spy/CpxP family protein refolding chaperone [Hyphomicrobium sp.]